MHLDPPPLPAQGFLLEDLGYVDEAIAAIALDVAVQTLIEYRKAGVGPTHAIVGRRVLYSKENLQKWLNAGGTRAFAESGAIPDSTAKAPKLKAGIARPKPRAKLADVST